MKLKEEIEEIIGGENSIQSFNSATVLAMLIEARVRAVNDLLALFAKFGKEIIQKDEKLHKGSIEEVAYDNCYRRKRNELRVEQRKRLKEMIGED